jgi:hypothetical protein
MGAIVAVTLTVTVGVELGVGGGGDTVLRHPGSIAASMATNSMRETDFRMG